MSEYKALEKELATLKAREAATIATVNAAWADTVAAITAERDALKATVARLSAPVSDEELVLTLGNEPNDPARLFARAFRGFADSLIASRTTPPKGE